MRNPEDGTPCDRERFLKRTSFLIRTTFLEKGGTFFTDLNFTDLTFNMLHMISSHFVGPLFIAVRGPLTIAASLVAEHRLQTRRLSNCGSRA